MHQVRNYSPAIWFLTPHDVARLDVPVNEVVSAQMLQTFGCNVEREVQYLKMKYIHTHEHTYSHMYIQ